VRAVKRKDEETEEEKLAKTTSENNAFAEPLLIVFSEESVQKFMSTSW
jgi:hypothetical protein